MTDLIRRSAVIDAIRGEREYLIAHKQLGAEHVLAKHADAVIDSIPAVDAVEVRHGRWECIHEKGGYMICHCSHCGIEQDYEPGASFCKYCGARMDGRREEEHNAAD